jgi:threonine/homoserine efflux transporter RhtA
MQALPYVLAGLSVAVVLVTSILKTVDMSTKTKQVIAIVTSVLAGLVGLLVTGKLDNTKDIAGAATAIYAASQVIYHFIISGTSLNDALEGFNIFGRGGSSDIVSEDVVDPASVEAATPQTDAPTEG